MDTLLYLVQLTNKIFYLYFQFQANKSHFLWKWSVGLDHQFNDQSHNSLPASGYNSHHPVHG